MLCKLCGTNYPGARCTRCGLASNESPTVAPLDFGKHKGATVEAIFKSDRQYLNWMVNHAVGTPAQRAKARLLLYNHAGSPVLKEKYFGQGDWWQLGDASTALSKPVAPLSQKPVIISAAQNKPGKLVHSKLEPSLGSIMVKPKKQSSIRWYSWLILIFVLGVIIYGLISWGTYTIEENNRKAPTLSAKGQLTYSTSACRIKGNGTGIYHLPGQEYYEVTVISPEKGERWFCTEQDAIKNGWRKSKV